MNKLAALCLFFALAWVTAIDAAAQQAPGGANQSGLDRVWLQPIKPVSSQSSPTAAEARWYPGAIEVISGRVIAFDSSQLRVVAAGEQSETLISADRVLWIEPSDFSNLEREAIQLYREGKHAESLTKLPGILQRRPAVWRQQWATMLATNAAWKSGRSKISLELLGQLDRRPLPPLVIAWLPIAWRSGVQPADAVAEAKQRLSDPSPAVQLVAASWLLSSPERRQAAVTLTSLASHGRAEVASLAGVLLWRIAPPPQVIESARDWENKLEALPMVLQSGPTTTLIDKFRTAGLAEQADRLQWSIDLVPIHPQP